MEALSPRSANLPMKPALGTRQAKSDGRMKAAPVINNPDKIEEEWRPAGRISEPGSDGDTYLTGKKLGRGGFAVCFEGKSERTRQIFALKVVKSQVEQKKQLEKFRTELQIHAKMHHPSIVEFYRAFAFESYTYVVLELCPNGSLIDMVKNRKSLSLPEVRRYMVQICGGVKYMHQRWVIHRDLKMGNIFLDTHMNVKIGDFGLAAVVVDDQERRQTMCGTPNYIAPELLARSSSKGHGHEVDTWAIGIICYAMLIGSPPFASKSQSEIYNKLKQLQYEWKEDCQYFIPSQAKNLVTLCLNLIPGERPGMDDLVEHEFFKMGVIADELDRSCLKQEPTWLKRADPRGDKVMPGHGVSHAAICEACGVGKDPAGRRRSAVGGNVNISAMSEVDLENTEGCAPVVPMPEGVVYKEFAVAKKDWNATKKRPLTKIRSRKEVESRAQTMEARCLTKTASAPEPSRSTSTAVPSGCTGANSQRLPPRTTVQSFAAQQRQQALPSQPVGRKTISIRSARSAALPRAGRAPRQAAGSAKQSQDDSVNTKKQAEAESEPVPRSLLCEQPVRAASRVTRSTSTRNKVPHEDEQGHLGTTTSEERATKISLRPKDDQPPPEQGTGHKVRTTTHVRPRLRQPPQKGENEPLASERATSSGAGSGSADQPLRVIDANDRQTEVAHKSPRKVGGEITKTAGSSSPRRCEARVIAPTDNFSLVPESAPENVLSALRDLYRELSPRNVDSASSLSRHLDVETSPRPVVEKWVDYSERYGVCYILSDGTAGLTLRSSENNMIPSSYVVVRNGRGHYSRRALRQDGQIVPQGPRAPPVEFYEQTHTDGIKQMEVSARSFRYVKNDDQEGSTAARNPARNVLVQLSARAKGVYEAERVRMVGLLDKFGRYMVTSQICGGGDEDGNNNGSGGFDGSKGGNANSGPVASTSTCFVKFYQRLGNVGIWGFGDGTLQFNFPDHTKLVVYRSSSGDNNNNKRNNLGTAKEESGTAQPGENGKWMLDLYHLTPLDATDLATRGSLTDPATAFDRRDSLTCSVAAVFVTMNNHHNTTTGDRERIFTTSQVPQKLAWIRAVVRVWIREAGLGRMGKDDHRLAWTGVRDRTGEREARRQQVVKESSAAAAVAAKMTWVTVGREGGDG